MFVAKNRLPLFRLAAWKETPDVPRLIFAAALATGLAACAETGDFGRPKPSFYNEIMAPFVGQAAAGARGEPASSAMLTDDEQVLRQRAYQFIMPARTRNEFERQLADLTRQRITPKPTDPFDVTAYYEALQGRTDRSVAARYQALRQDMENDRLLLGPFVATACRVTEADRIRLQAAGRLPEVSEASQAAAAARVAENDDIIIWVNTSVDQRLASYRYALQNMVVQTPDRDAIKVERVLTGFESDRAGLDRCLGKSVRAEVGPAAAKRWAPRPEQPKKPPK